MIARRQTFGPGQRPDLQEMDQGRGGFVSFAVRDATATRGELDVTTVHAVEVVFSSATVRCGFGVIFDHGIPVSEFSGKDVGEYFCVAVSVGGEAVVGSDAVFV